MRKKKKEIRKQIKRRRKKDDYKNKLFKMTCLRFINQLLISLNLLIQFTFTFSGKNDAVKEFFTNSLIY